MNTIGYFEIQSNEPEREIKFYKSIFGWTFIRESHVPIEYYRIETSTIYGGLLKRPAWQGYFLDPDKNTFGIFEVDNNAQ